MVHPRAKTALLLSFLFLGSCGKQKFGEYAGLKIPQYDGHSYENGSVAAQPGVRIHTPSGNVIIVTIRKNEPNDPPPIDPAKEMNGWIAAAIHAYTAESIVADVSEENHAKVVAYDIWRKNDKSTEVQTKLPLLISSNRKIFLPESTVSIECLLIKGDINQDLQTIKNLTHAILTDRIRK